MKDVQQRDTSLEATGCLAFLCMPCVQCVPFVRVHTQLSDGSAQAEDP